LIGNKNEIKKKSNRNKKDIKKTRRDASLLFLGFWSLEAEFW